MEDKGECHFYHHPRVGSKSNWPSKHGLGWFDRFDTEPTELLFGSFGSITNRSSNRFEGRFELASYLTSRFGELISTWAKFKN
jgi:hypothetical protein